MMINTKTNMPFIPSIASEKLNVRLKPAQKLAIKKLGVLQKQSMSKAVLDIFDYYFSNAVPQDFWRNLYNFSKKPAFRNLKKQVISQK
jgi:hypothetical protein